MSPEQSRGEDVDHRTDIWAFGVMLYELATGQRPFRGDYDQAVVYSIINEEPEPITGLRTGVPMELERIVAKAIAKRADERYQDMDDLLVDLRALGRTLEAATEIRRTMTAAAEPTRRRAARVWVPAVAAVIVVLVLVIVRPLLFDGAPVSSPTPVVVISFENQTGDSTYDYLREAIPNLLITNLERSRYLSVTTWERMRDLLKQIGREDVEFIDKDLGFELSRMEGVDAIVLGSFTKAGETFATDVKVLDVDTKSLLRSANSRGKGVDSILNNQIDELSKEICRGVGMSERRIGSDETSVVDVTTTSMEAYSHFLRGRTLQEKFYFEDARQALERAVEIDPTFAMAYVYLADAYSGLNNVVARNDAVANALRHAGKATERERLLIEGAYAIIMEGDRDKALAITQELISRFPREKLAHRMVGRLQSADGLAEEAIAAYDRVLELDPEEGQTLNRLAYLYAQLGDFDRALEYARRYVSVLPGDANPLDSLAEMYFMMGRLDDALSNYEEALRIRPDFGRAAISYIHAINEDYDEALKSATQTIENRPSTGLAAPLHVWNAFLQYWVGNVDEALSGLDTAAELARTAGNRYWEDQAGRARAWALYYAGDPERGRAFFSDLSYPPDDPSYANSDPPQPFFDAERSFYLGLADLSDGRVASARSWLREIDSTLSREGRFSFWQWAACLRDGLEAEILLHEGSIAEAVKLYQEAPPPEMAGMHVRQLVPYNLLFRRDALARAYVRNGEPGKAIAEYERLLSFDPESEDRRLIPPLCRYRLARLYEEEGRSAEAVAQYERFLEIWKDADEGLLELEDARVRLAALTEG
jgi:tetratricopeptide (TPR) repeat protein